MSMVDLPEVSRSTVTPKGRWSRYAILILLGEKVVQHIVVTLALVFNWGGIGSTVHVPPAILAILGSIVAVLFGVSLWGMIARKQWAPALIIGLAAFDIAAEFVSQGTLIIATTVSFLVATTLLLLALRYRSLVARPDAA
jgi:hypothetical protein